ncbi:hypothetical protein [Marinomonas atlantica]|uniref:hypothetical protein n=1 Tax=Marinomonas atlantica TaxID=1806668 RepID=UPI0008365330|nr:hypothetical protein [Marinomonas atlantica]MCO4786059.1 hypothetical protein [Marinomonas atlantica]
MKLIIPKKQLGSLSSILMLSLFQPSASADETLSTSTSSGYETYLEERPIETSAYKAPPSAYRVHSRLTHDASDIGHYTYKANISQVFDDYHQALEQLEEHYQDGIDNILDQYESELRLVQLEPSYDPHQISAAKQNARKNLKILKQKHISKRAELEYRLHVS